MRDDPAKLLTSPGGRDLQRNAEGTAIIGDPRNDSHVVVSQMHLAFCHAHNAFVDRVRSAGVSDADVFPTAARELRWNYQAVVLREFLPRLIGPDLMKDLLTSGRRFYCPPGDAFMPLEFADAAYRYGHSQIRHTYVLNGRETPYQMLPDLLGFRPVPDELVIDWAKLFDANGKAAQRAKKIDGRLVREQVGIAAAEWHGETPLWYYLLREADVCCHGNRLGPVGGRIVGEVLLGLLDLDQGSVRHAPADWKPTATLVELLGTRD